MVATHGNQRQIGRTSKSQKQAKSVATGCHQFPETFHGKEAVPGSSPGEGWNAKQLQLLLRHHSPAFTLATYMHLLPDGNVLAWGKPETPPAPSFGVEAAVWDPTLASPTFYGAHDSYVTIYCSGHSFLEDGRLLAAGGHIGDFVGSKIVSVFGRRVRKHQREPGQQDPRGLERRRRLAHLERRQAQPPALPVDAPGAQRQGLQLRPPRHHAVSRHQRDWPLDDGGIHELRRSPPVRGYVRHVRAGQGHDRGRRQSGDRLG